jgi:predicted acylesterase/phospholipase RssA
MREPMTITLGGGGAFAFGYHLGLSQGLRDGGVDIATSPLLGTSGGAHAAAAIATGMTFDEVAPVWERYIEAARPLFGRAGPLAEALYASQTVPDHATVGVGTVRLLTFRRKVMWHTDYRLPDMVAASSSILPFTRSHKIGKRRYIDGGHRSATSADLAPEADLQLMFVPFAFKSQGFIGRVGARQIRKEVPKWEARSGGKVIAVLPNDEMVGMSKGLRVIGDMDTARMVHDLAVPVGRDLAALLRRDHQPVIDRLAA